ncbi:tellurite resistance/C4-dicarboxylate transporter family protein [Hymenobacter wooponensis]|uniref:C4-dicarboxylate ABC transporter n=1 Tax=Hymenobacter wooponensis TaxID=1525360 RepID=A0A4Z0MSD4_9BACT|nr:tellurite resistance/C4-dicarboxylate transporter family protein [Hymenobacter wooponensis]TGD82248.1 C4-dicarboxylate ABC transporter [Hymenobacter wooponensis]
MLKSLVEKFSPVYFTMVMATGIISLAAEAQHIQWLAEGFFYLNVVLYPLFLLLLLGRLFGFYAGFKSELASHENGPNFLALIAATCLVGNQFVVLRHNQMVGQALWLFGAVCWIVLLYVFLISVTLRREKPPLETGLGGNWLLLAVSTQALAILGAVLLPSTPPGTADVGQFTVLGLFLLGSLFYIVVSTLLFYRLTFVRVEEQEVGAPYWISVGGSAITVMAGATLLSSLSQAPALADIAGFVKAWCVLFWVVGTWWLPFVAALRAWHHLRARPAFSYKPAYWSMVFPLGMYTASTGRLAQALPLPALRSISAGFIWIAVLAWAVTLIGMLVHLFTPAKSTDPVLA